MSLVLLCGFCEIKDIRNRLIDSKGSIIAPCPNIRECPMLDNDWCHSTCRVSRSKIHKLLKSGEAPYEDEKFSYISVTKELNFEKNIIRVLRHPKIESGKIGLRVCTSNGIEDIVVTKKDKERFKIARKVKCGEVI